MRAVVAILGLVLGVLAGIALLLLNPLTWLRGLPPLPSDLAPTKAYRWDAYRGIDGGVRDLLGMTRRNRAVALKDSALSHMRIGIVVLPAGEGAPAALAVKVSVIAGENSLWRAQLGTHDYWSIFWPGEGSVFAIGYSNYWPVARDAFFAAILPGDRSVMSPSYALSAPSRLDDPAGVTGASGRYAGFTGEIREQLYLAPPGSARSEPDWTLAIKANPPPVATR
ncbi:MAG: hypothetical protein ABIX37_04865 [Gammaproteobacteria bacterium]